MPSPISNTIQNNNGGLFSGGAMLPKKPQQNSTIDTQLANIKAKNTQTKQNMWGGNEPINNNQGLISRDIKSNIEPHRNQLSGFALTEPNRVINEQTGQTAIQAFHGQPSNQGITGNTQTPSGATINTNNGSLITPPPTRALFPDIVSSLFSRGQQPSPQYNQAYRDAQGYNTALKQSLTNQSRAEAENRLNPIPVGDQTGREAIIRSQYLKEQEALGEGFQGASNLIAGANTQQQTQNTAMTQAGAFAQPSLGGFNQQVFNPLTQQFSSGGGGLDQVIPNIVQRLQNGTMSYNDALTALSGYGQGGINALQQALPPNFNIPQSNVLANQQGQVGPAVSYATQTLNKLKSVLGNLQIPGQSIGLTPARNLATGFSNFTGLGQQQTAEVKGTLNEARAALQTALSSAKGGTPTDYVGQSYAMLPDNPSEAQVDAAINVLNSLGGIRQSVYSNPGSSTNVGNVGGGSSVNIGNTSYYQDANGTWHYK